MRRHRHVMNAMRSQVRKLEGNPGLPGGVMPPSIAWLESNCIVTPHDYGNGNVQYEYTCEHLVAGGKKYRCTWTRWSNSMAIQLSGCVELARPHYHEVHGGSEGPQSYGAEPPWQPYGTYHYGRWTTTQPSAQPYLDESLSFNYGRVRTNPDPQTPVCPPGQEPCGNTTNGGVLCCDIPIKGPTPAGVSRRPKLGFRDRIKLSYRLLFR